MVTVDNLLVKAASSEQIPECIREIKSLLRQRHHIKTGSDKDDSHDDFNICDMSELKKRAARDAATVNTEEIDLLRRFYSP